MSDATAPIDPCVSVWSAVETSGALAKLEEDLRADFEAATLLLGEPEGEAILAPLLARLRELTRQAGALRAESKMLEGEVAAVIALHRAAPRKGSYLPLWAPRARRKAPGRPQ